MTLLYNSINNHGESMNQIIQKLFDDIYKALVEENNFLDSYNKSLFHITEHMIVYQVIKSLFKNNSEWAYWER